MNAITRLFALGLLILAGSQLLAYAINMPDFIKGSLAGLGIGIEIVALVMLKKFRTQNQKDRTDRCIAS